MTIKNFFTLSRTYVIHIFSYHTPNRYLLIQALSESDNIELICNSQIFNNEVIFARKDNY